MNPQFETISTPLKTETKFESIQDMKKDEFYPFKESD